MSVDRNEPAFPAKGPCDIETGLCDVYFGLTKREWFAGMAMQGFLASWPTEGRHITQSAKGLSEQSFVLADAMLSESQGQTED